MDDPDSSLLLDMWAISDLLPWDNATVNNYILSCICCFRFVEACFQSRLLQYCLPKGKCMYNFNGYGQILLHRNIAFCIPLNLCEKPVPTQPHSGIKLWGFCQLIGKKWCLRAVLVHSSLIMKEVEHFIVYLESYLYIFSCKLYGHVLCPFCY